MYRRNTYAIFALIGAILATIATADPTVHLLPSPSRSAQARFEVMRSAEQELLQMVYVFQDDASGFANAAMLRERARNGIKVRLLIDSFSAGHRISPAIL